MSDDQEDIDIDSGEMDPTPKKRGGFLSPLIIRILELVALAVGVIILVIITNIVYGSVSQRKGAVEYSTTDTPHRKKMDPFAILEIEAPFRQKLSDGKMIQLKLSLGYKQKNKKLQNELSQIIPDIVDTIVRQLSKMSSKDFVSKEGTSLDKLEETFLKHINRKLANGRVEKIYFLQFTLMD